MKEPAQDSHYFTELDAILDTRMGTLMRIRPEGVPDFVKAGYFVRDRDLFPGVEHAAFKELYAQRDKATLKLSVMTPIVNYCRDFCIQTYEGAIMSPFRKEPKVIINLHPYKLSDEEKELLLSALTIRIGHLPKIEFVDMTYEQITPSYLKKKTSICALYDPFEWLEVHSLNKRLQSESCPDVMMLGPLMLRNVDNREIDVRKFQADIELMARPFVDLNLISTQVFSADVTSLSRTNNPAKPKETV